METNRRINYMEYMKGEEDRSVRDGKCPDCGKKLIDGSMLTVSPDMHSRTIKQKRTFKSKGCVPCMLRLCYDDDKDKWFRPLPKLGIEEP
jgi:hypothetical protein